MAKCMWTRIIHISVMAKIIITSGAIENAFVRHGNLLLVSTFLFFLDEQRISVSESVPALLFILTSRYAVIHSMLPGGNFPQTLTIANETNLSSVPETVMS